MRRIIAALLTLCVTAATVSDPRPLKNLLFFRLKFQIHTKNPPVSIILVDFS